MLIIPMFEEDVDETVIVISNKKEKEIEFTLKNWQKILPELQLQLIEIEINH